MSWADLAPELPVANSWRESAVAADQPLALACLPCWLKNGHSYRRENGLCYSRQHSTWVLDMKTEK